MRAFYSASLILIIVPIIAIVIEPISPIALINISITLKGFVLINIIEKYKNIVKFRI